MDLLITTQTLSNTFKLPQILLNLSLRTNLTPTFIMMQVLSGKRFRDIQNPYIIHPLCLLAHLFFADGVGAIIFNQ